MIYTIGNKSSFAFVFQIVKIDYSRQIMWGGFEMWIDGIQFGDAYYYGLITGNNLDLVRKIAHDEIPTLSVGHANSNEEILKEIFDHYTGEKDDLGSELSRKQQLHSSYEQTVFWGRYILVPNNFETFDGPKVVYFIENEQVKLLLKQLIDNHAPVIANYISISEIQNTARQFLERYCDILEAKITVQLASFESMH